jgi:TM2 domain-containing membrane protein YozV
VKKIKNKYFYVGLSLMLPGAGQFALRRYFRGLLQVAGAAAAILWLAAMVIMPIIDFYTSDPVTQELPKIRYFTMVYPILLFIGITAWSIIDLLLGFDKNVKENE